MIEHSVVGFISLEVRLVQGLVEQGLDNRAWCGSGPVTPDHHLRQSLAGGGVNGVGGGTGVDEGTGHLENLVGIGVDSIGRASKGAHVPVIDQAPNIVAGFSLRNGHKSLLVGVCFSLELETSQESLAGDFNEHLQAQEVNSTGTEAVGVVAGAGFD